LPSFSLSSPSPLLPVPTTRAVAHGGGWGCCRGGCHHGPVVTTEVERQLRPLFLARQEGSHPASSCSRAWVSFRRDPPREQMLTGVGVVS
jgi:hypothetical protein